MVFNILLSSAALARGGYGTPFVSRFCLWKDVVLDLLHNFLCNCAFNLHVFQKEGNQITLSPHGIIPTTEDGRQEMSNKIIR